MDKPLKEPFGRWILPKRTWNEKLSRKKKLIIRQLISSERCVAISKSWQIFLALFQHSNRLLRSSIGGIESFPNSLASKLRFIPFSQRLLNLLLPRQSFAWDKEILGAITRGKLSYWRDRMSNGKGETQAGKGSEWLARKDQILK